MLFERQSLTPQGKADVLARLFTDVAENSDSKAVSAGVVPRNVLEAYGDLSTHVRFMVESAAHTPAGKANHKQLRKVDKLLDQLPETILMALPARSDTNWMLLYRALVQLHGLLEDSLPEMDAEEYTAIVQKLIKMAESVAEHAAVRINAASMFTLLLMQVHLHKYSPTRKKATRKPRKATAGKKKAGTKRSN
ncbi:MAG: hypothetical protein E7031_06755 [Akkermansiaceae bacterium]|nr:hypothetical protein [Akkermansiaceae bacterium]